VPTAESQFKVTLPIFNQNNQNEMSDNFPQDIPKFSEMKHVTFKD